MKIDIDYEHAIDFEHCESINIARDRLSKITNLLNKVIKIRHSCKNSILLECSKYEHMHKLSWDNKMVELVFQSGRNPEIIDLVETFNKADEAYHALRNKQAQVIEDLWALKKIFDSTPN